MTAAAGTGFSVPIGPACPALYVVGVQGTGQSSLTADPLADTGLVGALIGPVVSAVPGLVQRSYIPYGAGFGGVVPGGSVDPYVVSVTDARARLDAAFSEIASACPSTLVAGVAYSQGAQAMASLARDVGAGAGPVGAERVAGIALYANPERAPGAPVLPGRPGQSTPDPAPGTSGGAVAGVHLSSKSVPGSGIAETNADYGALTGRVADICDDGDLACSAPDRAALLRFGAELFAQADLRNPLAALGSVNTGLHAALNGAWTAVILNDIQLAPGGVAYLPQQSLAERIIAAADPRLPTPTAEDTAAANARWAEITATLAAAPLAIPAFVGQLAAGWARLVADNADLINPAVWLRFADTVARHNGYALSGQLDAGIAWLIALANDIAGRYR
ncbi:cutinase family protein [Nocardia sp. NPDC052566]|uniref:cutinase family protein n=1 Tax=Nocardia sp. NPDC052566 TaxID=3364330 RepID=UPI0037C98169